MPNTVNVSTQQYTYMEVDTHLLLAVEQISPAGLIAVKECAKRLDEPRKEAPLYIRCGDDTRLVYVSQVDFFNDPEGIKRDEVRLEFRKVEG